MKYLVAFFNGHRELIRNTLFIWAHGDVSLGELVLQRTSSERLEAILGSEMHDVLRDMLSEKYDRLR